MSKYYSIAIDGPGGAGKSTVAKALAQRLDITYLDTGAMYRAAGLYLTEKGISLENDEDACAAAIRMSDVRVVFDAEGQHVYIDGKDYTPFLRTDKASKVASKVAKMASVRRHLVAIQRAIGDERSIVIDGRDIGTVVLPAATLKIYLTASAQVRAMRRFKEQTAQTYEQILAELIRRDEDDSSRAVDPMRPAPDAVILDTSDMTFDEVIDKIGALLKAALGD